MGWWQWLVAQGLYRDLVGTAIALGGARLVAWRPLREHRKRQDKIADLLDTKTDGGLKDIRDGLDRLAADHHETPPPPGRR